MDEIQPIKEQLKLTQLAYQMAAQINQFKTGFLARTAHELRSPISTLMGLHQLILSDLCESPEEEREFLQQAHQATQKLLKIIDEIVKVSQIEYGRIPLEIKIINLNKILSELYQLTHLQAANRNIALEIIYPEKEIYIQGDEQKILQALTMLVDSGVNLIREGKILINSQILTTEKVVITIIEIPCEIEDWEQINQTHLDTEKTTIEEVKRFSKQLELSPGMKLLLAKTLIETMRGHIDISPVSPEKQTENVTQIKCSLPLAVDGFVAQESATD